ncbi:MAG TPA: hypothetical protein VG370_21870 [Chloroflexota bacterium]|nr:hypothetical protein [Chloroflexota bacterium]
MQAGLQAGDRDGVVEAALDRDVGGLQVGDGAHHLGEVGEDGRARAQQLPGLVGQELGRLALKVADRRELHVARRRTEQRGHAAQVAPPHTAAADRRVPDA